MTSPMCVYKPRAPSKEARLADQRFQERPRIGSQAERCACAFNRQELGAAYGNIEFKDVLSQVLEPDSRLAMVDEVDRAGDAYIKGSANASLALPVSSADDILSKSAKLVDRQRRHGERLAPPRQFVFAQTLAALASRI